MTLTLRKADPREPQATALLQSSHALMQSLYSPDECHFLDIDALCAPEIHLFVVEEEGRALGCGALAVRDGYGEVKSMFTDPEARGRGVAALVLAELEALARRLELPWLRLETGHVLHSAHRLYERSGFVKCGPFGSYVSIPASLFYEKPLAA